MIEYMQDKSMSEVEQEGEKSGTRSKYNNIASVYRSSDEFEVTRLEPESEDSWKRTADIIRFLKSMVKGKRSKG